MTWLFVVIAIGVLAFVFLVVLGPLGELPPAEPDLKPEVVDGDPQFDVVVRGYRMDEVDQQVATLQERIAALEGQLSGQPVVAIEEAAPAVDVEATAAVEASADVEAPAATARMDGPDAVS